MFVCSTSHLIEDGNANLLLVIRKFYHPANFGCYAGGKVEFLFRPQSTSAH
mgnify:CR=1 FL=1